MADPVAPAPEPTPNEPLQPASTPPAPVQDNGTQAADTAELKAQLDKMEMERNLLRKKVDAQEKAERERQQKELEEKEDYRTIAERAVAEAEALRKEKTDREALQATESATAAVYAGFDARVVEVAKTAGLTASDDSDAAKEALKSRLEAIQAQIGAPAKAVTPTPNNPAPRVETPQEITYNSIHPGMKLDADTRATVIAGNNKSAKQQVHSIAARLRAAAGVEQQEF